jgi:uncharacterized protein (DUF433 family)
MSPLGPRIEHMFDSANTPRRAVTVASRMTTRRQPGSPRLLNAGIYDLAEVARLVRLRQDTVARWMTGRQKRPPLLKIVNPPFFTFHDLISLYVIGELHRRGVSVADIQKGGVWLSKVLGTDRPFAHKRLATVGRGFFADALFKGEWLDVGQGGQSAFPEIIEPILRPITFGSSDGMAQKWVPHKGVSIDPRIQAGAPCVVGTRVPTSLVASLVAAGEPRKIVATDYQLTQRQISAAVDYEAELAAAA